MRIGFDIDGVIACFYEGYERLMVEITGVDRFGCHRWPHETPAVWDWPQLYGYAPDVIADAWKRIKASETFWLTLPTMPDLAALQGFNLNDHQVYFVTDRPGATAKRQTELWLMRYGVACPTVIISRKGKGIVCEALDLELYIDDKGENIVDVDARAPNTHGVLLERPYNQHVTVKHRAETLADVLPVREVAAA